MYAVIKIHKYVIKSEENIVRKGLKCKTTEKYYTIIKLFTKKRKKMANHHGTSEFFKIFNEKLKKRNKIKC